jgi:hypothetical protein
MKKSPEEQLREHLTRLRRTGVPFDRAWPVAFERVRWPHDTTKRRLAKEILNDTREAWRSAYERTPWPGSVALRMLAEGPTFESDDYGLNRKAS